MEDLNDSSGSTHASDNNIRLVQANLQAQLESFHKENPNTDFIDTYNICENVKNKVLNYEDEPHLSKAQNNHRRISIASDLFINICSIYECIVDYEFTKIIKTLVQWEKYKYISQKITKRMQLELKKEKYFVKEAQSKLQKSIEGAEERTSEIERVASPRFAEGTELRTEAGRVNEKSTHGRELEAVQTVAEEIQDSEINGILGPALEYSDAGHMSDRIGNFTEVRAEPSIDTSLLQLPTSHPQRQFDSFPAAVPEISTGEPNLRENTEGDLNQILQILEDQINEKEVQELEQPETLLETPSRIGEAAENIVIEKSPTFEDESVDHVEQLKSSEEWDLPDLEPVEKIKKGTLKIDKIITIHNYSERALYLNRKIHIQRVQVFEGPPKVLHGMSANHLMKATAFKSSLFSDVRSGKLNRLFERHMKQEKAPLQITSPRKRTAEPQQTEVSKVRTDKEIVEVIGMREGMHSVPGKADVLAEAAKEKSILEELMIRPEDIPSLPKESLIGMPMSRIVSSAIQPPDMERINAVPVSPTPRAQQLQGKTLDPDRRSSWFHSTKENPPSAKYREFNYVYKKLQEYWSLFETQGMEKSITLREFFHFEVDSTTANFLTVLRIVDKLSLQRKLLLEFKQGDVLIRPFENPFVTEKQLLVKAKEPIL